MPSEALHNEFLYDLAEDDSIFRAVNLATIHPTLHLTACTVAGSKDGVNVRPNEDAFSVIASDQKVFAAVFDGCSSQKPIVWLPDQTGARFASHYLKKVFEQDVTIQPNYLLESLNNRLAEVAAENHAEPHDANDLPATTATIVSIDFKKSVFYLSHVGDTFCVIFKSNGDSELVTIDLNEQYDQEIFRQATQLAKDMQITPRQAFQLDVIKQAIKNKNSETHNRADGKGQGIMNGSPDAPKYFQYSEYNLDDVKAILIGSDGLVPPGWSEHDKQGRTKLLEALESDGFKNLIKVKKQIENDDQDWQLTRYKHSDDATGVFIQFR